MLNFCCSVELVFAVACASKKNCRFVQSEPSFSRKQPVVLCKVSRRFPENNPSFCAKCIISFIMKGRLVVRDSLVIFID